MPPTDFYFTVHPGDMMRSRLPDGCRIMIVAAACWDNSRRRLRVRRPPADHIASLAIDSGGFTAAKRWGRYPWSIEQYVEWIRETARDVPLDFCASMDYACERGVDRSHLATNQERILQSIANDYALRDYAPDLPWLSVLQGNTFDERAFDLATRERPLSHYAGLGSICGRPFAEARDIIRWYARRVADARFHVFGLDSRALDADDVYFSVASWDSYAWNWPRGARNADRPPELHRKPGETWSSLSRRVAQEYWSHTVEPRVTRPRQLPLLDAAKEVGG